jgi:hypothetical protein
MRGVMTIASRRIDEAQRMAGLLNQDANALAADAAKTINDVLGNTTKDVLGVAKDAAQKTDEGQKEGAK